MSGRTNFRKLREEIERDPERRARMDETRKAYDALLHLADLRQSKGITQADLASALGVSQPNVSKIERSIGSGKGEVLLGTLAGYIEALGGRLEVRAVFPEHPEDEVAVTVDGPAEGVAITDPSGDGERRGRNSINDTQSLPVWFPEPSQADDSWAERGESTTSWIERSSLPRARATRRFLNENIHALPKEYQPVLYQALHNRWSSAFFELIVARTLQVLGASIKGEPGGAEDIRIDFVAGFPESTISFEAVAPAFNVEIGEQVKQRNPLLDIVESLAPSDLWVLVESLPDIGPDDSKKSFKRAVRKLLSSATEIDVSSSTEFIEELPQGTLRLRVIRKSPNASTGRSIGIEPALTAWDDTEQRVRRAVDRKRRQGRESATPALLAIHATGMSSSYEEFDQALFGRTFTRIGLDGQVLATAFDADGIFNKGSGIPTWAGVLAFVNVGFRGGVDPVLYIHPRFEGKLPEALLTLEQRTYNAKVERIEVHEPSATGILEKVGLVSPDV